MCPGELLSHCQSFRWGFTGLVEVYTKVTWIVSEHQWIAFRTWISSWNYSNCIRLGFFLQCCWSGRTGRLCKCKSCHVLLLFNFELIVHGWMLNMFCNLISISIWKEPSLPLLSNVSFRNSADVFRIGEKNGEKQVSVRLPSDLRSAQTFWWGLHAFEWVFYTGTTGDRHLGLYWEGLYKVLKDIFWGSTETSLIFPMSCTQVHDCET